MMTGKEIEPVRDISAAPDAGNAAASTPVQRLGVILAHLTRP
jgi:hypothetical protein